MTHKGSCHCGQIKFEVEGTFDTAMECNCSHCSRKGYLLWFVPRTQFQLQSPESAVAIYTFTSTPSSIISVRSAVARRLDWASRAVRQWRRSTCGASKVSNWGPSSGSSSTGARSSIAWSAVGRVVKGVAVPSVRRPVQCA